MVDQVVSSPHQATPLYWAARGDAVKYIIQAGVDINIKNDHGVSE